MGLTHLSSYASNYNTLQYVDTKLNLNNKGLELKLKILSNKEFN